LILKDKHLLICGDINSVHVQRWCNSLSGCFKKVTLVSVQKPFNVTEDSIISKLKKIVLPFEAPFGYILNGPAIRRIIQNEMPDIIHVHSLWGYGFLFYFSGIKPDVVSVYGFEVFDKPRKSYLHKKIILCFLKRSQAVASTSSFMAEQIQKLGFIGKIHITPFGVDTNVFQPAEYHEKRSEVLRIGIVKHLSYKYGIDTLIEAFAIAKKQLDEQSVMTSLYIYGEGKDAEKLKELAISLEVKECIYFKGSIPNQQVPAVLQNLDIFCMPSRLESESFGVAALEAMSCGLPVIASDIGGLPALVEPNSNGILVPPDDVKSLSEAIIKLALDTKLRNKLGSEARKFVMEKYTWNSSVDKMMSVYSKIINRDVFK